MPGLRASVGSQIVIGQPGVNVVFTQNTQDVWWEVFGCDISHSDAVNAHHLDIFIRPQSPTEGNAAALISGSLSLGSGQAIPFGFTFPAVRPFEVPPGWGVLGFLHTPPAQDPASTLQVRLAFKIRERDV